MFFETEKDYLEYQKLNTKQISIKKKMVNKQKLKNPEYKFQLPEDEPISSSDSDVDIGF